MLSSIELSFFSVSRLFWLLVAKFFAFSSENRGLDLLS